MHVERMQLLHDQISRLPEERFHMEMWIAHKEDPWYQYVENAPESCETVACAAGWCSILNGGPKSLVQNTDCTPFHWSMQWLGLTRAQAEYLFLAKWTETEETDYDPRDMVDVSRAEFLEHLASAIAGTEEYFL